MFNNHDPNETAGMFQAFSHFQQAVKEGNHCGLVAPGERVIGAGLYFGGEVSITCLPADLEGSHRLRLQSVTETTFAPAGMTAAPAFGVLLIAEPARPEKPSSIPSEVSE